MTNQLAKPVPQLLAYDETCRFLATVTLLPDAEEIEDKADGLIGYARACKDPTLLAEAVRIKMEAGRHIGRVITEMQKRGELATRGKRKSNVSVGEHFKTLNDIGFSARQSGNYQWLWRLKQREYDRRRESIVKKMVRSLGAIYRQAANDERRDALFSDGAEIAPGLHVGDFRELSPGLIADDSVQLVFIDPPYDRDSLPLYGDAAAEAARILRPGGSLISYVGHSIVPEAAQSMARHLKYFWTGAVVHSGQNRRLDRLGIIAGFKPLLWFVKEHRGDIQTFVSDTVVGAGREKTFHNWQQAENEAAHFIDPLTSIDGMVVDFFVGGGTTLLAAKNLKRNYIGFEINPATALKTADRLR